MIATTVIDIAGEPSAVGAARRAAVELATQAGLDEESAGRLALVVTELGTNILKHTSGGSLLLRALPQVEGDGVEVLSLDRGPGMRSVAECLRDGYSSAGTRGAGLGAVMRAATAFDVQSTPGKGTAIVARVSGRDDAPRVACLGVVCVPQSGQTACGDGWGIRVTADEVRLVVVDGLGHGHLAAEASDAALRAFYAHPDAAIDEVVARCHDALRSTRGAVLGIAALDRAASTLSYIGVGNVMATILAPGGRHGLASQNGTLGQHLPELRVVTGRWEAGSLLVLNSDGLSTRWSAEAYPGLLDKHPSILAGVLHRDFSRGHDDATVVALHDGAPIAGGTLA